MLRQERTFLWALVVILPLMSGPGCPGGEEPWLSPGDTVAEVDSVARKGAEALPEPDATLPEPDVIAPDVIDFEAWVEPDVVGYENDWELVMIVDSPDNTLDTCNAGNPGADIDAVELYRDNNLHGWANSVEAIDADIWSAGWPCDNDDNDKDDPEEMLGQADGMANPYDGFEGYFSLNGRTVYLLMSEIVQNGDELVVYEMFNPDNPDAAIEDYKVYLGFYNDDGDMAFTDDGMHDWNTGVVWRTIDGLW